MSGTGLCKLLTETAASRPVAKAFSSKFRPRTHGPSQILFRRSFATSTSSKTSQNPFILIRNLKCKALGVGFSRESPGPSFRVYSALVDTGERSERKGDLILGIETSCDDTGAAVVWEFSLVSEFLQEMLRIF